MARRSALCTLLREGDRVAVYPKFEAFDITPLLRVREQPLRDTRSSPTPTSAPSPACCG